MKKIVTIIALISACVTLTACNKTSESSEAWSHSGGDKFADLELAKGHCDRVVYEKLTELEVDSDLIVVGEFIGDASQNVDYAYDSTFDKDVVVNVTSTGTLRISKVLKGEIAEGDCVDIYQRYGIVDGRLVTFSELTPMQDGDEWLFFLKKSTGVDGYWCSSDTLGRYPIPSAENAPMPLFDNPEKNYVFCNLPHINCVF